VPLVVVPDPSLVALVGPAGSGKSTLAARHFAPAEVLSSDAYRALIAGDARDQRATRPAFAALHRELGRRLRAGRLTVVDATSVERHARRALLVRARQAGVPAVAIVLDLAPKLVLARNDGRPDRRVDPEVVRVHLAALRRAVDGGELEREGWTRVVRVREPAELDALRLERRAR
jgi:protein phosphatase